ncbi:hypothetical protein D3C80_1371260 [compost metagenome]
MDLVDHHPQVMGDGESGDGLQGFRVALRAGQVNCPGPRGNRLGQRCGFRRDRHLHQLDAAGLERRLTGQDHRIEDNHLVTCGQQAHRRDKQGVLRPVQRDHARGLQLTVQPFAVVLGKRLAQGHSFGRFAVVGVTFSWHIKIGVGDEIGGGKIRGANTGRPLNKG